MAAKNLMTPSMLAKELNEGSATVRFWLNRFSQWLPPYTSENGEKLYHIDTLRRLLSISEKIGSGMLPTEIEKALDYENKKIEPVLPTIQSVIHDIPMFPSMGHELQSQESIKLITTLFEKYYSQQERFAAAEDRKARAEELKAEAELKRANAEEQKAEALSRRAEAESHKAHAINNLADTLKTISNSFLNAFSEKSGKSLPLSVFESNFSVNNDTPQETQSAQSSYSDTLQNINSHLNVMDDLASLITDETQEMFTSLSESDMDDLTALIEDDPYHLPSDVISSDMDDLSALIEDDPYHLPSDVVSSDMDDLTALIEEDLHDSLRPNILDSDVDDLLSLIGDDKPELMYHADFLDNKSHENDILDDLSLLIEETATDLTSNGSDSALDDLISLIDNDTHELSHKDLFDQESLESAMVDEPSPFIKEERTTFPEIEMPKSSLENNFEQYKSEVINIIIKLRKHGHDVDATTEFLNREAIKTLSGKNRWTTKMIAKIYTFIEAAEK